MSYYGTESEADTYHSDRQNTAWAAATSADKLAALLRGSEAVDFSFRRHFPGTKSGDRAQVREWPREWAVDIEGESIDSSTIPREVKHATYEAALRELATPGVLMPDLDNPGQQPVMEKVGPITVEYAGPLGIASVKPIISKIAGILEPVLTGVGPTSVSGSTARI